MYSCFHTVGLPDRSLAEAIELVADAGYAAIELNAEALPWAKAHITPAADKKARQAVVKTCKARGIIISAISAHMAMVGADPARRDAAIRFVEGSVDLARDVGAPVIHILSGPMEDGVDRNEAWNWFRGAVEETTVYAAGQGIVLGIEAIAGHLFHCVGDYHALRRDLPGVPFKVNFDPSHLEVQGENPHRVVDELADQIVHVHLKDGKGSFPRFEFPPLGRGTIDFMGLVHDLRGAGYAGALSVEYEAQVYGYHLSERQILAEGIAFYDVL
ncbi:MAG: sugar phosphate isomerase/epimerase family protein [Acetobacteraceae bacterium]